MDKEAARQKVAELVERWRDTPQLFYLETKRATEKREQAELERTLSDRRQEVGEEIERLDREIDALVYGLYGLTEEEIAEIRHGFPIWQGVEW